MTEKDVGISRILKAILSALKVFCQKAKEYVCVAKIELIILAVVLIFDIVTKQIVIATMPVHSEIEVIPSFFHLYHTHNPLAAFGQAFGLDNVLGTGGVRIFFIIITVIALAAFSVMFYLARGKNKLLRFALALIIAGAIGNFIDRVAWGYVVDFVRIVYFGLNVPFFGRSFAIFNIADVALVAGMIMFTAYYIFIWEDTAAAGAERPPEAEVKSEE